jgi:prolipoprotein diacylglyceryltransferase
MFPIISFPGGIQIYTFGLSLSVAFLMFFWMVYKLSNRLGINNNFFLGSIFWFFLSTFIFSRLFFVCAGSEMSDYLAGVDGLFRFFVMPDYYFSFMGGVFGFLLVLFVKLARYNLPAHKYIDTIVLSFFFASVIGFIGAFFGDQILGTPTNLPIGVLYESKNNIFTTPVMPLAILYALVSLIMFIVLYILRLFVKLDGFVGYLGIIGFSACMIVLENWAVRDDILSSHIVLNLNQLGSIVLMLYAIRGLYRLYHHESL